MINREREKRAISLIIVLYVYLLIWSKDIDFFSLSYPHNPIVGQLVIMYGIMCNITWRKDGAFSLI